MPVGGVQHPRGVPRQPRLAVPACLDQKQPRGGVRLLLDRLAAVLAALTAHRLEPKRLQPVQKRADTAPWLFLLEARLDGRPGLTWLPPLVLYTEDGQPSAAMREIYRDIQTESR